MNEAAMGLVAGERPIPLEGVRVDAKLSGPSLEVTVTQRYRNTETVPVEAVYVFPLEEGAAVCGFAALVGDRVIRGRVEEREKAFAAYDDAMMEGHGAFLLDQERPNVFTASVGNLKPGETVEVQLRYVTLARREGEATRLAIPTTVSPRYAPAQKSEVGQPDAERVSPEKWPSVPYGLALCVEIETEGLKSVESPSHPVRATLRSGGATVELSRDEVALDRDFVLLVSTAEPHRPFARVAREEDGRRVAMLSFCPELLSDPKLGHEVLFVLDCSGSMQGDSIAQARRALALCIRALGANDAFNVVRFGSTFASLWPLPRRFDDASLDEASEHVGTIDANLGGTEILAPLSAILEAAPDPERARRVLLLTDGQVSNEAEVIALAKRHAGTSRIFSFGIGAGASEHLVRGVARTSRGAAEMIFPGERIEPKVMRMFDRVRTPVLDDVHVDYGTLKVEQAPTRTPPVFRGDDLTIFARIESGEAKEVALVAGDQRWAIPLDLERAEAGGPIPVLWARERIRELEDGEARRGSAQRRPESADRKRDAIVELGVRYGLMSSETSYVAIEERPPGERTVEAAELRRIPVALTDGWGGGARAGGQMRTMAGVARGSAFAASMGAPGGAPRPAAPPSPAARYSPPPPMRAPAPMAPSAAAPPAAGSASGRLQKSKGDSRRRADSTLELDDTMAAPDRLFDLLMTQKADGHFARSRWLDFWLGARRAKLDEAIAAQGEAIAVTAVVIALLAHDESSREAEWKPAVTKAKAFLAAQGATFDGASIL